MKGVACVIMNRVHITYGEYGRLQKNIRAILYQPLQFDCVQDSLRGRYNPQNIYNMRPEQVHYDIANWAIAGNRLTNLGFALWYFNRLRRPAGRISLLMWAGLSSGLETIVFTIRQTHMQTHNLFRR